MLYSALNCAAVAALDGPYVGARHRLVKETSMTSGVRTGMTLAAALIAAAALTGCASSGGDRDAAPREERGGFLGFGGGDDEKDEAQAEIGVNSFLWRASLDTLAFMPLASADPFGGVIITDWYANPDKPTERFKATVYILDTRLRADGIKVSLNRQTLTANGWMDAASDPETAIQIENAILTRARQLRLANVRS
jgi:hypothetical protein